MAFFRIAKSCVLLVTLSLVVIGYSFQDAQGADARRFPTVTIATLDDYYPYCFRIPGSSPLHVETIRPGHSSAQLAGLGWETVRKSLQAQGYTIRLLSGPWARAIHNLETDKADLLFPVLPTKTRQGKYLFSKNPVDTATIVLYTHMDSPPIRSLEDLDDKEICVVRKWSFGDVWERNHAGKTQHTDTVQQAFDILHKKRVDAVVGYEECFDHTLTQMGLEETIKKSMTLETMDDFVACKAASPRCSELLTAFDNGYDKLKESGKLELEEWNPKLIAPLDAKDGY